MDHRATGGAIWVIENEKSEAFMRRLERETGFVFEFVRYGDLVTRHRPAWRLKRQSPMLEEPVTSAGAKASEDALPAIARECGCEIVDHRASGGGFWVIKSKAASQFLLRATSLGFTFDYHPTGGRATNTSPLGISSAKTTLQRRSHTGLSPTSPPIPMSGIAQARHFLARKNPGNLRSPTTYPKTQRDCPRLIHGCGKTRG